MLRWSLMFFIVSLVAAFFGFSGVSEGAAGIAKILFFGFIILTGVVLAAGLIAGKKTLT